MEKRGTHINQNNYESWFLDFLEGQLTDHEEAMLRLFLDENPALKEELKDVEELSIPIPADINYPHKEKLLRAPAPFQDLSLYDYLMVKSTEGELDEVEQQQLDQLFENSTVAERDLQLFHKAKLAPSVIEFPKKQRLLRHSLRWGIFPLLRVAAAVILVFILFNYRDQIPEDFTSGQPVAFHTADSDPIDHIPEVTEVTSASETIPFVGSDPDAIAVRSDARVAEIEETVPQKTAVERWAAGQDLKPLPGPTPSLLDAGPLPNSYEAGLRLMLPMYIENYRYIAHLDDYQKLQQADTKSLLERTTILLSRVTPLNLSYNRIYDEQGELVAINVASDNFELLQRVSRKQTVR